jgi:NADH dehydrogenase (ubiquinone) 1 beta subcomplex subunit 8
MSEDDPRMIGDYPDVPAIPQQLKDPYATYYEPQARRNFGDPIPEDYEPLLMWSFDIEDRYGPAWILASFGGLFGGCALLYWLTSMIPNDFADRRAPRHLPTVGSYFISGRAPDYMTRD